MYFQLQIPAILALIEIWHNNFHGAQSHAILPYNQSLKKLPDYIQQIEMESNGQWAETKYILKKT